MDEQPENSSSPPPPPYGQGNQPYDPYAPQAPPYPGYDDVLYGTAPARHSGLGIASMIIGIISMLMGIIGMVFAVYAIAQHPEIEHIQPGDQPPPELIGIMMAFVCPICGGVVMSIVGLILGIIGLVQTARLKLFAIIGTILNGLVVGGVLLLMLIGLVAGG